MGGLQLTQEGSGRDEGSVQGCEFRLQREGPPGAVDGQLPRRTRLNDTEGVGLHGVQVRPARVPRDERRLAGEGPEDVWRRRLLEVAMAGRRGCWHLPVRR